MLSSGLSGRWLRPEAALCSQDLALGKYLSRYMSSGQYIMDSIAVFRMDIGLYAESIMAPTKVLYKIHVPAAHQKHRP